MMMLFACHSEIQCRQHREHVRLDVGDQKFKHIDKYSKTKRYCRRKHLPGDTQSAHSEKNENHAYKCQHDNVSGGDVSEKSYRQNHRFCETSNGLNQRHDWQRQFQEPRHTRRVENILVIFLVSEKVCYHESEKRQNTGDGDVSCKVRPKREKWNQAKKVVYEDKEKHRDQIWQITVEIFVAYGFYII